MTAPGTNGNLYTELVGDAIAQVRQDDVSEVAHQRNAMTDKEVRVDVDTQRDRSSFNRTIVCQRQRKAGAYIIWKITSVGENYKTGQGSFAVPFPVVIGRKISQRKWTVNIGKGHTDAQCVGMTEKLG